MTAAGFHAVATVTRRHVLDLYELNSCIASTRILIEVLRYFGMRAEPLPVGVLACNVAALPLLEQGTPLSKWPAEAYSVGVDAAGTLPGNRWGGHLVAAVDGHLVDPSADQFNRPDHGIAVPGPVVLRLEGWPLRARRGDTTIVYWPADPAVGWTTAPDWSIKRPQAREAVRKSIRDVQSLQAELRPAPTSVARHG